MAYTYGRPFRYQKRRPSARGAAYRSAYSRSAMYPRRPAGSYSRYSRKKTSRYGRPKTARRMVITPKNGFVQGDPVSQYQLSQIDAFDPRAVGVRIPDSNATPSVGVMVSDDLALNVPGTTGFAQCFAFQPSIATTIIAATGTTASAWTWAASFGNTQSSGKATSIGTNYDLFRPVAHGVRISSSLASTAATGFVHIAVYPSRTTLSTWDFPTSLALMADCMWYTRVTVSSLTQTPYLIQNKFLDCTAQRYIATAASNAQGDNPTAAGNTSRAGVLNVANEWCTILIALEGTNPTAVANVPVSVETLVHYEALPAPGGVQAGAPAAQYDPADLQAGAAIGAQMNPVSPVTPGGSAQNMQEGTTIGRAASALGNLAYDVGQSAAPQARSAFVNLAGGVIGGAINQYAAQRGSSAQNNIGLITN